METVKRDIERTSQNDGNLRSWEVRGAREGYLREQGAGRYSRERETRCDERLVINQGRDALENMSRFKFRNKRDQVLEKIRTKINMLNPGLRREGGERRREDMSAHERYGMGTMLCSSAMDTRRD